MKNVPIISLSIILTACGGSDDSKSQADNSAEQLKSATYELALNKCGTGIPTYISSNGITGVGEKSILLPSANADLLIEGGDNNICITGNMNALTIKGLSHDIFVEGSVNTLTIEGSNNHVIVFDDVLRIIMSGSSHDVFVGSVATYEDLGMNNKIMEVSNAKL